LAFSSAYGSFLGVLEDIVTKDPLVTLNISLHNTLPLFRSTGMTWFMLTLTQFGSAMVLSILCLGAAALALARQQRRLATTVMFALTVTRPHHGKPQGTYCLCTAD